MALGNVLDIWKRLQTHVTRTSETSSQKTAIRSNLTNACFPTARKWPVIYLIINEQQCPMNTKQVKH